MLDFIYHSLGSSFDLFSSTVGRARHFVRLALCLLVLS